MDVQEYKCAEGWVWMNDYEEGWVCESSSHIEKWLSMEECEGVMCKEENCVECRDVHNIETWNIHAYYFIEND